VNAEVIAYFLNGNDLFDKNLSNFKDTVNVIKKLGHCKKKMITTYEGFFTEVRYTKKKLV